MPCVIEIIGGVGVVWVGGWLLNENNNTCHQLLFIIVIITMIIIILLLIMSSIELGSVYPFLLTDYNSL